MCLAWESGGWCYVWYAGGKIGTASDNGYIYRNTFEHNSDDYCRYPDDDGPGYTIGSEIEVRLDRDRQGRTTMSYQRAGIDASPLVMPFKLPTDRQLSFVVELSDGSHFAGPGEPPKVEVLEPFSGP